MPLELKECGTCKHLNLGRCSDKTQPGYHWCEHFNDWRSPLDQPNCPEWALRACGNCVVYNGDEVQGFCSVMGERKADEAPCRRWFGKRELMRGLYGRDG